MYRPFFDFILLYLFACLLRQEWRHVTVGSNNILFHRVCPVHRLRVIHLSLSLFYS